MEKSLSEKLSEKIERIGGTYKAKEKIVLDEGIKFEHVVNNKPETFTSKINNAIRYVKYLWIITSEIKKNNIKKNILRDKNKELNEEIENLRNYENAKECIKKSHEPKISDKIKFISPAGYNRYDGMVSSVIDAENGEKIRIGDRLAVSSFTSKIINDMAVVGGVSNRHTMFMYERSGPGKCGKIINTSESTNYGIIYTSNTYFGYTDQIFLREKTIFRLGFFEYEVKSIVAINKNGINGVRIKIVVVDCVDGLINFDNVKNNNDANINYKTKIDIKQNSDLIVKIFKVLEFNAKHYDNDFHLEIFSNKIVNGEESHLKYGETNKCDAFGFVAGTNLSYVDEKTVLLKMDNLYDNNSVIWVLAPINTPLELSETNYNYVAFNKIDAICKYLKYEKPVDYSHSCNNGGDSCESYRGAVIEYRQKKINEIGKMIMNESEIIDGEMSELQIMFNEYYKVLQDYHNEKLQNFEELEEEWRIETMAKIEQNKKDIEYAKKRAEEEEKKSAVKKKEDAIRRIGTLTVDIDQFKFEIDSRNINFMPQEIPDRVLFISVPIENNMFSIGRSDTNNVTIKEGFISRTHAEISKKDGFYQITDKGSLVGTYLGHDGKYTFVRETYPNGSFSSSVRISHNNCDYRIILVYGDMKDNFGKSKVKFSVTVIAIDGKGVKKTYVDSVVSENSSMFYNLSGFIKKNDENLDIYNVVIHYSSYANNFYLYCPKNNEKTITHANELTIPFINGEPEYDSNQIIWQRVSESGAGGSLQLPFGKGKLRFGTAVVATYEYIKPKQDNYFYRY